MAADCPEGQITEICTCDGAEHSNGYCCTGIWDQNVCRLFYEDCEDTTYSEHFLERHYGTTEPSYWAEFTSEVTRSTDSPHSGSYCMTYDPWTTGNPHGNVGYDVGSGYGNTAKFHLKDYNNRIWYFRWYHKWEPGISYSGSAKNKNLYIGYHEWGGDFVLNLEKVSSGGWHLVIFKNPGYAITVNTYPSAGYSVDDNQWHKMEVYIDLGTTGPTGTCTVKVDNTVIYNNTSVHYRDAIGINGNILNKMSWPANTSGTPSGTNWQWLDDLEIWDGMPNQTDTIPPVRSNPQPTGTLSSGTTQTTISLTTNETAVCKYGTLMNVPYDEILDTFSSTNATSHSQTITGLSDGNTYHYYVRCQDESGNQNTDDFEISFSVASSPHTVYGLSNFIQLAADWLKSEPPALESDVNGDGVVNTRDLGIMMSNWSE